MYSQGRHASGQPFKFSVLEICDRIKEEFQFLQAQYHSLKLECEKLATEKTEMQRHYVMYYEMSYGLNIEMHKQAEIVKRLTAICAQITPFLTQEHQQQVLQAMDRAKLVTMGELNNIIGQQQFQHLSHPAPPVPLTPHPSGSQASSLAAVSTTASGLLALSGMLGAQSTLGSKQENSGQESENNQGNPQSRSNSASPPESIQGEEQSEGSGVKAKLQDKEEAGRYESDGEKSDCNLIVDEERGSVCILPTSVENVTEYLQLVFPAFVPIGAPTNTHRGQLLENAWLGIKAACISPKPKDGLKHTAK